MIDEQKTKEQPITEMGALRQHVARLETLLTKHRQAQALCDISQTAGQRPELQELICRTLSKAVQVMGADVGLVYTLDMTEKALSLRAYSGLSEQVARRLLAVKFDSEDLRKMPRGEALNMSFSQLFRDATLSLMARELPGDQVQSLAAVAFWGTSGLHGVMVVGSQSKHKFDQDDMELLAAVGKQAAVGIENAMLCEEAGKSNTTDSLTGLNNQVYFQRRLEEEVARSSRYGLEFSLVMLDVDSLEGYIARRGPVAGNEIIRMLGVSILDCIRDVDIACRYDGSKFAVILPHTDSGGAQVVAERLRQKAIDIFELTCRTTRFPLAISLGIASFPSDEQGPNGLVRQAEVALAMARRRGDQACLASDIASSTGTASSHIPDAADNVEELSLKAVYAMAAAVDGKTHKAHSRNVARHAAATGEVLGLSNRKIRHLRTAAFLHDIGKARLPDSTVRKSTPLNEEEQQILRKHPELGASIISQVPELARCAPAIRHHHERYDGSGYPQGLKGEQIPVEASIIAVADAYDNMTTACSSRRTLSSQEALEEVRRRANTEFAPDVVRAFVNAMSAGA